MFNPANSPHFLGHKKKFYNQQMGICSYLPFPHSLLLKRKTHLFSLPQQPFYFVLWAPSFLVPQYISNPPSFLCLQPLSLSELKGSLNAGAGPPVALCLHLHPFSVSFTHALVSTCSLPYPRTIKCCCSMGFSMPESSQFTVSYGRAHQLPPIGARPPNLHLKLQCLF